MAVLLADVFAFRADARAEALVPGGVLFVFVGALGDERLRVATAVVVVGVGAVTTAILPRLPRRRWTRPCGGRGGVRRRRSRSAWSSRWSPASSDLGSRAPTLRRSTRRVVAEAASPRCSARSSTSVRDSTNRSTTELFRVRADAESLLAVDGAARVRRHDVGPAGTRPATGRRTADRAGRLTRRESPTDHDRSARRHAGAGRPRSLRGLRSRRPAIRGRDLDPRHHRRRPGDRRHDRHRLGRTRPRPRPAGRRDVRNATRPDPHHACPTTCPTWSPRPHAEVTAGATSTYDARSRSRTGSSNEFDYSLEVQTGHGNTAIESFLRDRVGYCEQFAGDATPPCSAPSASRPAWPSGSPRASRSETASTRVLGRNAHAWPEVWFDGIGWVAFEPTPGRGAPAPRATPDSRRSRTPPPTPTRSTQQPTRRRLRHCRPVPIDPAQGPNIPDFDETPGDQSPAPTPEPSTDDGAVSLWLVAIGLLAAALVAPSAVRLRSSTTPGTVGRRATRRCVAARHERRGKPSASPCNRRTPPPRSPPGRHTTSRWSRGRWPRSPTP